MKSTSGIDTSGIEVSRRRWLAHAARSTALLAGGAVLGTVSAAWEARAAETIRLRELYEKDLAFSAFAESRVGDLVAVRGFMAPPLKAESRFFVLTKRPMATCPFCNDADDWPSDIAAVYAKRVVDVVPFNVDIVVRGQLSLGDEREPETGFFSRLRLVDATFERA